MLYFLNLSTWDGANAVSIICSFSISFHRITMLCLLPSFTSRPSRVSGHGSFLSKDFAHDHLLSSCFTCNAKNVLVYGFAAYVFIIHVQNVSSLAWNCSTPSRLALLCSLHILADNKNIIHSCGMIDRSEAKTL